MDTQELLTRAVEHVVPRELAEQKIAQGVPLRLYLGIDPTGSKLHLGHSVPLRKLQAFADAGHHVIFLVGSFTAMIGDPTGKDAMREPLTREQVEANFQTYRDQASKVLDFDRVEIRYNHEWLAPLNLSDLVQLSGAFTLGQMLERDMFQERQKKDMPIGLHEFLYPLMVGYDSVMLDVDCEIGGSDQLFNMLCGRKLQKEYGKRDKFVLTTKLIEGTDGRKMSKTYDNCVWLEDTPADMYGKILRVEDRLIPLYFECCTSVPMDEIGEIEKAMKSGENPVAFKKRLAREIVSLYYGADAGIREEEAFQAIFVDKELPETMPHLSATPETNLLELLRESHLIQTMSEGRRLMKQGGITINDESVSDPNSLVQEGVIRVGKRKFAKIEFKR